MYSNAQPVIVERHLPLLPMGLVSPACCWASIDDDLELYFPYRQRARHHHDPERRHAIRAPCAVIVPAGDAHNFQFEPNASGMALTITAAYLHSLVMREQRFRHAVRRRR